MWNLPGLIDVPKFVIVHKREISGWDPCKVPSNKYLLRWPVLTSKTLVRNWNSWFKSYNLEKRLIVQFQKFWNYKFLFLGGIITFWTGWSDFDHTHRTLFIPVHHPATLEPAPPDPQTLSATVPRSTTGSGIDGTPGSPVDSKKNGLTRGPEFGKFLYFSRSKYSRTGLLGEL